MRIQELLSQGKALPNFGPYAKEKKRMLAKEKKTEDILKDNKLKVRPSVRTFNYYNTAYVRIDILNFRSIKKNIDLFIIYMNLRKYTLCKYHRNFID